MKTAINSLVQSTKRVIVADPVVLGFSMHCIFCDSVTAVNMKKEGIAITSAPGLPCRHIIHIVAQDTEHDWKPVIDRCLKMAEDNKIRSIAVPALGTGKDVLYSIFTGGAH